MTNYEKIDIFLDSTLTAQDEYGLVECLNVWDVGSPKWEEIAMSLFESALLYPLSQVVEYLRRDRQIDYYIDHIALLQSPEMVKKEEVFHALRAFRTDNEVAVQRVLCRIYKDNEVWDTLDSAIKGNNLRLFEDQVGGDDRLQDLKKITCHYQSITESVIPLYCRYDDRCLVEIEGSENDVSDTLSLEEMKQVAKEILSICAKLMLSAKEESYIKKIYNNPLIKNELSVDVSRYYYRIREKRAVIQKKVEIKIAKPKVSLDDYCTRKEAIAILKVCGTTLYNWRNEELPRHKIGRRVYYLKTDIEKAMAKKER